MTTNRPILDPSVYLLADHLDAALAAGEDLQSEFVVLGQGQPDVQADVAGFVRDVHALELILIARVLQARKRAEEIKASNGTLRPLISLFVSGTAALVDAAVELGDLSARQFKTGMGPLAFLRGRGLLAPDAAGLAALDKLAVTEDYLVAERIRLGTLLDLIAAFLDSLDLAFELYGERTEPALELPMAKNRAAPGSLAEALRRLS